MAIWQTYVGETDDNDHEALLDDPRVTHYYDYDLAVGRWFGERDQIFELGVVGFDSFVVFDSSTTFADIERGVVLTGKPILARTDELRASLTL